ncbi:MAG: hypothetical protein LC624_05985, partial [Halobacteriales archaeon]|nr:hypothetical protein [Halobacteriales archaeon]
MRALALGFALVLFATFVPAHAAPAPERMAVDAKSDGTSGVMPWSQLQAMGADSVLQCSGRSPDGNGCTLENKGCGSWPPRFCAWAVGWIAPPAIDPLPAGAFVGSTHLTMTGTYDPT